jgi:hypothetical protein
MSTFIIFHRAVIFRYFNIYNMISRSGSVFLTQTMSASFVTLGVKTIRSVIVFRNLLQIGFPPNVYRFEHSAILVLIKRHLFLMLVKNERRAKSSVQHDLRVLKN